MRPMSSSRSRRPSSLDGFCIDDKLLYASEARDFDRVNALVPLSLDFFVAVLQN